MISQILLILIDFDSFFGHFWSDTEPSSNHYTTKDI